MGCVVFNAFTRWSVNRAIKTGIPVIERIVTVSGSGIAAQATSRSDRHTILLIAAGGFMER